MPLRLRDNLHWCQCSGRIVFLDVDEDRYFCLPTDANEAFGKAAAGNADPLDAELLGMLTKRGLLLTSESLSQIRQPATLETPARDIMHNCMPRSAIVPILSALAWEARAAWQLRSRRFCDVIAWATRRAADCHAASPDSRRAVQSIAAAADAIAFVTRAHNRCLVRALGVHAACRARGIRAKLVLGVIAHPFAAHSWVQLGDAVVVGGYEQARLYMPILVIE